MLSSLTITNFALFKQQTVEFENGFNCLVGQSGAGKSIIIDALSFCLGAKADRTFIRSGENQMRVDGVFCNLNEEVKTILKDFEIETDELVISRTLSVDGKSSIKICGFPATIKMLQTLAATLSDFCGQHDSVGLLQVANHLPLLDKFGGNEILDAKAKVCELFSQIKEIDKKIASLGGDEAAREREKDLLQFQFDEIENANLQLCEEEELRQRFDFLSSTEKIFEKVGASLELLDRQRENATSLLYQAKNEISSLSQFKEIEECSNRIENSYYEIKDVVDTLDSVLQSAEFDQQEFERIDARLEQIKSLKKKYGKSVEEILDFQEKCHKRLEELSSSEEILAKCQAEKAKISLTLQKECEVLSGLRKKAAAVLEQKIEAELADLEMKGTNFKVDFVCGECKANGFDEVKFMFSANVGQEMRDLHKTASGGELSRLLLAFKNVMLDKEPVQTVVFDEIDSGISGVAAGKLARKLKNISNFSQIICISHSPLVAAKANNFILIEKIVKDESTYSAARSIAGDDVVLQIAKLIDGTQNVSSTALQHAKVLLCEQ